MISPSKKNSLRKESRHILSQLSDAFLRMASQLVNEKLNKLAEYLEPTHIACFSPMPLEPQIQPFMSEAMKAGKIIYLPIVRSHNRMHFSRYTYDESLIKNRFGITEPSDQAVIDPSIFEWVLVPLVCFDQHGHRIGHGAGFYDRFFAENPACKAKRIGVAYACQEVNEISLDAWDQPLDYIITENSSRLINTSR